MAALWRCDVYGMAINASAPFLMALAGILLASSIENKNRRGGKAPGGFQFYWNGG